MGESIGGAGLETNFRTDLETWRVRIRSSPRGQVLGAGVLLGDGLVLTCAHVIRIYGTDVPQPSVTVEFPGAAGGAGCLRAAVVPNHWVPRADDHSGDLALLRLDGPPPVVSHATLHRMPTIWNRRVHFAGYPSRITGGKWSEALIKGPGGPGDEWVQIDPVTEADTLLRRFSGAGVVDNATHRVIGIVVSKLDSERDGVHYRHGYMIPTGTIVKHLDLVRERFVSGRPPVPASLSVDPATLAARPAVLVPVPTGPADTAGPAGTAGPADTAGTAGAADTAGPTSPTDPARPSDSAGPGNPASPSDSAPPTHPAHPVAADSPTGPPGPTHAADATAPHRPRRPVSDLGFARWVTRWLAGEEDMADVEITFVRDEDEDAALALRTTLTLADREQSPRTSVAVPGRDHTGTAPRAGSLDLALDVAGKSPAQIIEEVAEGMALDGPGLLPLPARIETGALPLTTVVRGVDDALRPLETVELLHTLVRAGGRLLLVFRQLDSPALHRTYERLLAPDRPQRWLERVGLRIGALARTEESARELRRRAAACVTPLPTVRRYAPDLAIKAARLEGDPRQGTTGFLVKLSYVERNAETALLEAETAHRLLTRQLARHQELRGLLDGHQARLAAHGLAEAAAAPHQEAQRLLTGGPCELPVAAAAVDRFAREVRKVLAARTGTKGDK
ncbi:S1 family peptidase [Streptomyces agglomeratus]|uniref:S1 family peptidase n=1 Tax=Streptomyces agglomeratus TaxID=285458 RepID=UPI00099FA71E|nr:trypsin-like peptidase domain-containing protein [Streptomyces agglomeratus]